MCDNNENGNQPVFSPFFKRKQRNTEPWIIDMALNKSALFKKVKTIKLMLGILIPFVVKNIVHVTKSKFKQSYRKVTKAKYPSKTIPNLKTLFAESQAQKAALRNGARILNASINSTSEKIVLRLKVKPQV
jgi:hypothetical protein